MQKAPGFGFARVVAPGRAAWYVLDGTHQRGTGLGIHASEQEKEQALQAYLVEKHTIAATSGSRDPSQIPVADVLLHYVRNVLPDPYFQPRGDEAANKVAARVFP